ncbi:MAG TPA: PQQ-binding-like beta-propeller repeat protein [Candidatus Rifleibacterium sp.]|nr:PQQ-binding-like beta-propeller repeat protein [Candidatus Rifleibacterium sp.]
MDDVPIANNNPVNLIIRKPESAPRKTRIDRIKESLKNFFIMLPLALLVVAQFYFLGKSFGEFSTFPLTSITTYIFAGTILMILLFTQMLLRSIIYSTLAGIALIAGLYASWFGDFLTPMTANFSAMSDILKSAWGKKDLPYNLLMSGIMTAVIAIVAFVQFFLSLLVKSFFEMLFGKEWGDGRALGFLGAVALLAGIQISFYYYSSMSSQAAEKIIWKRVVQYQPVEKFITRVPGSIIVGKDRLWAAEGDKLVAINNKTGERSESRNFKSAVVHKGFMVGDNPVFAGSDGLYGFNRDLTAGNWKTPYPASFTGLELSEEKKDLFTNLPVTTRLIDNGTKMLVFFDFGYAGVYNVSDGSQLWFKPIDLQLKVNRGFPEMYLEDGNFMEAGDRLIFSCHNGLVRCLKTSSGEQLWFYQHGTPKVSGKSQRAFLSANGSERMVASFRSGEFITLGLTDGRRIYTAANPVFSPSTAPWCQDLQASFVTDEGIFYQIELDGGVTIFNTIALPRRSEYLPIVQSLADGIIAQGEEIVHVDTKERKASTIFKSPRRVFVTNPVVVDKVLYIGTQDGWIYCLHIGSRHEKWRVHVSGELLEDSLTLLDDSLLVKTRSGSLYRINRSF